VRPSRRRLLVRRSVVAALALALVAALVVAWRQARLPFQPVGCSAEVGGVTATLSPVQMGNAATIVGIAVRRGLPARAATIAIATALQESKLVNVRYGDRDSLGLFQQRPSQGWGTEAQVLDPVYATNAFYDRLVEVRDYRSLPITVAAQRVQRSGFPDAYAQHEQNARVVAAALTGQSAAAVSCALDPDRPTSGSQGPARLAQALRDEQPAPRSTPLPGRPGTRLTVRSAGPAAVWDARALGGGGVRPAWRGTRLRRRTRVAAQRPGRRVGAGRRRRRPGGGQPRRGGAVQRHHTGLTAGRAA
jgi:hypothetical protein